MSDSHDQSYYEIALTNRQVMSIFVVLLICVLVAFLGGVWLGRDADAAVEMASTQEIVAAQKGEEQLESLDFFTRRDSEPPGEGIGGNGNGGGSKTTLPLEEPETESRTASTVPAPERRTKAEVPPGVKAERSERTPVTGSPRAAGKSEPESSASVGASTAAALVIQVFSSNEEAQARRVVDQLRKGGYPALLSPVRVAGRTLHRVRIGPYTDPDEAKVVAESVSRTFKLETWITH